MSIAWKELVRQPRRFLPVGGALTLLVVLLIVLGGFLDGLELNQTGAYRAQEPNLLAFADDAELQIQRSRLGPDERAAVTELAEVDAVGGLDRTFLVVGTPDGEVVDVASSDTSWPPTACRHRRERAGPWSMSSSNGWPESTWATRCRSEPPPSRSRW